jgi:hypothetical protein
LGLTLELDEYERIATYARRAGRPVATTAKRVLLGVIDGYDPDAAAAIVSRDRERVGELEAEVTRLQAELAASQAAADVAASLPRWRWPIETLLADHAWWAEWLPRLGELIGRNLQYDHAYGGRQTEPIVDDRGFADPMRYLFPDLQDGRGEPVRWNSPEFPRHARLAWDSGGAGSPQARPIRAEVWEPVVRHVALALTALEMTSHDPRDAYAHLRAEAEVRSEWMKTLGAMLGEGMSTRPDHLPRDPLP